MFFKNICAFCVFFVRFGFFAIFKTQSKFNEILDKAIENHDESNIKPEWADEDEVAMMFGLR